jgi:hypothetical protein
VLFSGIDRLRTARSFRSLKFESETGWTDQFSPFARRRLRALDAKIVVWPVTLVTLGREPMKTKASKNDRRRRKPVTPRSLPGHAWSLSITQP